MPKKLRFFKIIFDDESLLYFPGTFLTGKVVLELDDDTPIFGLFFHIIGEGVVQLLGNGGIITSDKENYIDFRMKLLGDNLTRVDTQSNLNLNSSMSRLLVLSAGIHTFPFRLGLPLGLPSTFIGKHGWVQYYCRAELRDSSGLVHKNHQVFIVMNPIDLNLEPELIAQPFHGEVEEKFGFLCRKNGKIICKVRLDRSGYVPGESIQINAQIHNSSSITIKKTSAILTETVQYTSKNRIVQSEVRELASLEHSKIDPNSTDHWKNELLYIPPIPPTNLRGCNLIRIQYDVYFLIAPKGGRKTIKVQMPIMIATYPFRNSDGTLQRKKGTYYPSTLPISRSWFNSDSKIRSK
ncbi:Arrestin domain-containing protein 4 [Sarcoptes scabiei]|uniref:Arrestin domain-containing protein 4 n=1 Tax=Sarcoptes scabiei TaxID=52283 RepID=A0A132AA13_SARSC|nr:Arrestin domain-containing protein 4 [Sarcoptes scabiei]KPM07802.1 arrestin domain-containing protein 4 [Sarcoptes scabiei]